MPKLDTDIKWFAIKTVLVKNKSKNFAAKIDNSARIYRPKI